METNSKTKEIHQLIHQHYPRAPMELTSEMRFDHELNGDSLDIVELVMAIEKNLGVALPDREVGQIKTIGELIALVTARATKNN
jgi:acyl carrier protein